MSLTALAGLVNAQSRTSTANPISAQPLADPDGPPLHHWTGRKATVLAELSQTGSIRLACERANLPRPLFEHWRAAEPAFQAAVDDAILESTERLEEAARTRALHGIPRRTSRSGATPIREYSDALLVFLLKAHRPDLYHDRISLQTRRQVSLPSAASDVRKSIDLTRLSDEDLKLLRHLLEKAGPAATTTLP